MNLSPMGDPRFRTATRRLSELSGADSSPSQPILAGLRHLAQILQFETSAASSSVQQEREIISQRVGSFSTRESRPWKYLQGRGLDQLSSKELLGIAHVLAKETNLQIDREARRRKGMLVKWMDDNWDVIFPVFPTLQLLFSED
jgi:hypothetical protein